MARRSPIAFVVEDAGFDPGVDWRTCQNCSLVWVLLEELGALEPRRAFDLETQCVTPLVLELDRAFGNCWGLWARADAG